MRKNTREVDCLATLEESGVRNDYAVARWFPAVPRRGGVSAGQALEFPPKEPFPSGLPAPLSHPVWELGHMFICLKYEGRRHNCRKFERLVVSIFEIKGNQDI